MLVLVVGVQAPSTYDSPAHSNGLVNSLLSGDAQTPKSTPKTERTMPGATPKSERGLSLTDVRVPPECFGKYSLDVVRGAVLLLGLKDAAHSLGV